jgi:zinc protease
MPLPTLPPGITRVRLDNGLTVILQENHAAPVAALNVWVRVGSGDETDAESGIAHVHEHMLFKGTKRRGVGDIAREVEGSGGSINAYTSFDQTVYYCVMASRYFDVGIDVLADAVQNSTFDPEELAREEEVVLEEIKRGEDSPGTKLSRAIFETAYRVHPYRRPIIGTEAHVRSFTREMITDFYRRWYVPNNMVVVAVGDFDAREALAAIDLRFGAAPPGNALPRRRPPEPPQAGLRSTVLADSVHQGYLQMAFPACDLHSPDAPALDVLAIVLGQGESSRLYRRVKSRQGKVHDARAHAYTLRDPGLFLIGALADPEKVLEAQGAILREACRLAAEPVTAAELAKAKLNIETEAIYDKETVQGQAHKLGFYEAVADDVAYEADFLRRVASVTREEVQDVARRIIAPEKLSVACLVPPRTAPALGEDAIRDVVASAGRAPSRGARSARKTAAAGPSMSPDEAVREGAAPVERAPDRPPTRTRLSNGVTVIVKENHAVPVVAVRGAMLGGLLVERAENNGICDFIANMLTKGTKRRSAERIAEEIERIAGSINGFSGRNSLGVEIEVLSRYFDRGLDLFADVLLHPAFDPAEVEKQRADALAAIRRREDDLAGFTIDVFAATLYARHPYRYSTLGTVRSVKRISRASLRRAFERIRAPENLVISVVGDVKTDEVVAALERAFARLRARPFRLPPRPLERGPAAPRRREMERHKEQAHLVVGFLGTTVRDADRYAIEVLSTVLAGQGGRLFLELRDRQSLAYSVTSFSMEGVDPGYVAVYMGTSPQKLRLAIAGVRRELARIRREDVPAEELERAKRHVAGSYEIDLQRASAQAANLGLNALYGLGLEETRDYPEKILAVTAADVRRVARAYLKVERPVVVLIRPPRPGAKPKRAARGR